MDASCKKSLCMTSYGGIIRIRSRVEAQLLPLSPPARAPLFFCPVTTLSKRVRKVKLYFHLFNLLLFPIIHKDHARVHLCKSIQHHKYQKTELYKGLYMFP